MSSFTERHARIVPARLSYLAIYNPSLGPTDDTVGDQIVFYHAHGRNPESEQTRSRQHSKKQDEGRDQGRESNMEHEEDIEQNERLRQVGLAQGMVDFVKNFSNDVPLEYIEAEKSRVVLKEVEPQWWILASIDLTQLPITNVANAAISKKPTNQEKDQRNVKTTSADPFEYSSREVSPPQLLLSQLLQAHRAFLLHHASSLSELWKKHRDNRKLFCGLLERYWTRFILNWDVLLHGNPVAGLYDGIKLAGGGELGFGVGEEDWGSGEREVLEGFAHRTEGLHDLIVGRYGDAPTQPSSAKGSEETRAPQIPATQEPWLGTGGASNAEDGIIFSGIGGISRRSVATISQWMETIFSHGDDAYGVGQNPASRPRHRKKRMKVMEKRSHRPSGIQNDQNAQRRREEAHVTTTMAHADDSSLRRKAIENTATPLAIPAPLIGTVERSLDAATARLSPEPSSKSSRIEKSKTEAASGPNTNAPADASLFDTDKMMKYLSLGYGSSWTLNPKGFAAGSPPDDPGSKQSLDSQDIASSEEIRTEDNLVLVEPIPDDGDNDEEPFVQRLEQSIGKFLIGLSGDLENTEFEQDDLDDGAADASPNAASPSSVKQNATHRIFLRTLTIEISTSRFGQVAASKAQVSAEMGSDIEGELLQGKGKTSAAASVDGSNPNVTHERVQVAVYVHQPFVFVFLFRLHIPKLTMPAFYRGIHHTLGPLQKSLLRSTDPERWRERMKDAMGIGDGLPANTAESSAAKGKDPLEIYDFLYDPITLTIRTSLPNIPVPGTLAAEGLHRLHHPGRSVTVSGSWYTLGIPVGSLSSSGRSSPLAGAGLIKSDWTRTEALNTYTHIMNIWQTTRYRHIGTETTRAEPDEIERSVKTARGWWVVWMRVKARELRTADLADSTSHGKAREQVSLETDEGSVKEAFLVRRSPERNSTLRDVSGSRADSRSTSLAGRWLLRDQPRSREVSGSGGANAAASMTTNAKGVGEGVGIDARKWVEGLIKLSM